MKLLKIINVVNMDSGAPQPIIISNDNELFIAFYKNNEVVESDSIKQHGTPKEDIIVLRFKNYLKYTLGLPGDETIYGHPYHKLGLESFEFYEMNDSPLIQFLKDVEKIHPYYDDSKWESYKHYILTFKDSMFECVSQGFEIKKDGMKTYNKLFEFLNSLSGF